MDETLQAGGMDALERQSLIEELVNRIRRLHAQAFQQRLAPTIPAQNLGIEFVRSSEIHLGPPTVKRCHRRRQGRMPCGAGSQGLP